MSKEVYMPHDIADKVFGLLVINYYEKLKDNSTHHKLGLNAYSYK